jgi:purine nucleoside phosphorylase
MLHRHSGKGYATEAARATLNHAQRELGVERVIAIDAAGRIDRRVAPAF